MLTKFKTQDQPEELASIVGEFESLANHLCVAFPESSEREEGLKKLLAARNCFLQAPGFGRR